jgi:hypothetical protein
MMCMRLIGRLIRMGTSVALMGLMFPWPAAGQERFRGMDRDGDGVITRAEWRGNDRSFRNHDTNNDGVLSGAEVRAVERDEGLGAADNGRGARFTDWTENRFADLDRNRDGRLSAAEWPADRAVFAAVDRNDDQSLSRAEFLGLDYGGGTAVPVASAPSNDRFDEFDRNRDGTITMNEWPRSELTFRRRDRNGNGAIERNEFPGQRDREDEAAYRHGYDRGLTDGRAAGRGDRNQGREWDLEGQRELEQADAGYTQNAGEREDYQVGYRAGFRVGYEQGYNRR